MDHDGRMVQVALAASEVEIIAKQFVAGLGRAEDWDPEEFDCVVSVIPAFKFPIFLAVLESKYAVDQDPLTLVEAVRELQDHFLHDVLRKGRLGKQMDYLPLARYCIIILLYYYILYIHTGCPKKNVVSWKNSHNYPQTHPKSKCWGCIGKFRIFATK